MRKYKACKFETCVSLKVRLIIDKVHEKRLNAS